MTTERAKAELEQIYGILSSEKQQALDVALKALNEFELIINPKRCKECGHFIRGKDGKYGAIRGKCFVIYNCLDRNNKRSGATKACKQFKESEE